MTLCNIQNIFFWKNVYRIVNSEQKLVQSTGEAIVEVQHDLEDMEVADHIDSTINYCTSNGRKIAAMSKC